ncbi:MAG: hypothetical protein IJY28_02180, partial [Clostridia bacterium]|nr:hypothetical protein [Clostridia bacterium]
MNHAIYYDGAYLLLPDNFPDYEAFLQDLCQKELPAKYRMVVLREDHQVNSYSVVKGCSMAPYFLSGYNDAPSIVTITDKSDVYPAQVEILTQQEYNAKLRERIGQVCPGCLRFKPLSNRVQSLNGHFEEMTLDGVCMFRQESKPSPRIFREYLFFFGGFFRQFNYADKTAPEMLDTLKECLHLRYRDANLIEENGQKTLTVSCRKNELLTPLLTYALSRYVRKISDDTYHICSAVPFVYTEDVLNDLLSEENAEAFRKECKKYGISLSILEYDPCGAEKVHRALQPLVEHFQLFPLLQTERKTYYLMTDT